MNLEEFDSKGGKVVPARIVRGGRGSPWSRRRPRSRRADRVGALSAPWQLWDSGSSRRRCARARRYGSTRPGRAGSRGARTRCSRASGMRWDARNSWRSTAESGVRRRRCRRRTLRIWRFLLPPRRRVRQRERKRANRHRASRASSHGRTCPLTWGSLCRVEPDGREHPEEHPTPGRVSWVELVSDEFLDAVGRRELSDVAAQSASG